MPTKLPLSWTSNTPKGYQINNINAHSYQSKRIPRNFHDEINHIRNKFTSTVYPLKFINSVINNFMYDKNNEEEEE